MSVRPVALGMMALVLAGCMGNTITPNYSSSNPNLQVGGKQPARSGTADRECRLFLSRSAREVA
jgi:hypothetical protein